MRNRAALMAIPVLVAAAIVVGLAAAKILPIAGTSPSGSPSFFVPSPSASPAASPPATPSPQPTPTSSPKFAGCGPLDESVPLALRVEAFSETGRWWVISVYEDGHILTPAPLPGEYDDGAWMVARRLSSSGVEQFRAALLASGLFEHSGSYGAVSRPGVTGPEFGGGLYAIELGSGVNAITVSWVPLFPNDEQYFEPSPERAALDPLAERLIRFDPWLADDAWADPDPCTVQALRARVYLDAQPYGGALANLPPDIADVPWPLGGDMLAWGADVGYQAPSEPYHVERCGIVPRSEALRLVNELRAAEAVDPFTFSTTLDAGPYISLELGDRAANRILQIFVQPVLPDDYLCTNASRPYGGGI